MIVLSARMGGPEATTTPLTSLSPHVKLKTRPLAPVMKRTPIFCASSIVRSSALRASTQPQSDVLVHSCQPEKSPVNTQAGIVAWKSSLVRIGVHPLASL